MLRRDRITLIAVVGWLISAASPQPSAENQPKKTEGQSQIASGPPSVAVTISKPIEIFQPKIDVPPCGPNQYQANDDLCAQWKAADAASRAAIWAMIGTIVAAIGTVGLYWQIKLTREAVEDTGKATEAMQESNEIAKIAQRPWLTIEAKITKASFDGAELYVRYKVQVKNIGQMVAERCCIRGAIIERDWSSDGLHKIAQLRADAERMASVTEFAERMPYPIIPGDTVDHAGDKEISDDFERLLKIGEPRVKYVLFVCVRYHIPGDTAMRATDRGFSLNFGSDPDD